MEIQNFSLSQACDKTENIFLYFFTKLKTNHLSYSISIELADHREHTEAMKPYALVSGLTFKVLPKLRKWPHFLSKI